MSTTPSAGRVALLSIAALGCGDGPPVREWHLPELSRVAPEVAVPDSTWNAIPIREYGTLDGELAFGMPYSVATLPDGALVVADAADCTLIVIDRPSARLRHRWGGCGEGPGEFRFIRTLTIHGDSLFVYDQEQNAIVVLSSAGVEARRIVVRGLREQRGPFTLSHLDVLDDSTLLVSTEAPGHSSVALMSRQTGEIRNVLVGPPPIATRSDAWIRRMGGSCVQPGAEAPVIIAMSEWAMEGVGLDADTKAERFHFLSDLNLPPRLRSDGIWAPGPWGVDLRCGKSLLLGRVTTLAPADRNAPIGTARASSVVLEARGYNGSLFMRWWIADKHSLLRGVPSAFRGDTLFVISTRSRPYPIVGEVVFEPNRRKHRRESKGE